MYRNTGTKRYVIKGSITQGITGGHQPPNQRKDKSGSQGRVIVSNQLSMEFSQSCLSCDSFCSKLSFQECIENALAREKQFLLPGKRADLFSDQFDKNSVSLQGKDGTGLLADPFKRLGRLS